MQVVGSAAEAADLLHGCRVVNAEFMYRTPPVGGPARAVFEAALRSRLAELAATDGVLWIADSLTTLDQMTPFMTDFSHLRFAAALVHPPRWSGPAGETPFTLGWPAPDSWSRYAMTDRWARLDFALETGAALGTGWLTLPAHDAVWGRGLLTALLRFARAHGQAGLPAAVSPYAAHPHGPLTGVMIPEEVIDLLNAAFEHDSFLRWKLCFDRMQGFWGKMALLPCVHCAPLRAAVDCTRLEDDLHIDRVLREQGVAVRAFLAPARHYRQVLPVFDRAGARAVIERTLHYSLNVPGAGVGSSLLNQPRDWPLRLRARVSPRFARACQQADALIAECGAEITARLVVSGASWVDWGVYRHVVRVGDPAVEVWRQTVG